MFTNNYHYDRALEIMHTRWHVRLVPTFAKEYKRSKHTDKFAAMFCCRRLRAIALRAAASCAAMEQQSKVVATVDPLQILTRCKCKLENTCTREANCI
jgi:hypothetical protein